MQSSTPSHISITPRHPEFNFEGLDHTWLDDTYKRHFLYALSIFIPLSERCVSDILRTHLPHIKDDTLKQDIQAFIKQESRHGRLHLEINNMLKGHYKAIAPLEFIQNKFITFVRKVCGKKLELAMPVVFEHFTAAISRKILTERETWLSDKNPMTAFVYWHCLEELEHQSVCLDVYQANYKSPWPIILSLGLFWAPISFITVMTSFLILLLQKGNLKNPVKLGKALLFMGKHSGLFFKGIFKYKNKQTDWQQSDKDLYKNCLQEFELRINDQK